MSIGDEKDKRLYCDKHGLYKTKLASGGFECIGCLKEEIAENEDTNDTEGIPDEILGIYTPYLIAGGLLPLMIWMLTIAVSIINFYLGIVLLIISIFQALCICMVELQDIRKELE